MDNSWLDWAAVALLGAFVGASELVSRYKDHPYEAVSTWPAYLYVAINAAASLGALGLIHAMGWFAQSRWTQVITAGLGAMAFFRTSLFIVRAGDRDVSMVQVDSCRYSFPLLTGQWTAGAPQRDQTRSSR